MRKLLLSTVALLAVGAASSAFAADSAPIAISAELAQSCTINSGTSTNVVLDASAPSDGVPGTFNYQCNFTGSPTLKFTSANKGAQSTGPDATLVGYGIYLNDTPPSTPASSWQQASATPASYTGITTTISPNTQVSPSFRLGLDAPLVVAGTYTDTLTIDIAP